MKTKSRVILSLGLTAFMGMNLQQVQKISHGSRSIASTGDEVSVKKPEDELAEVKKSIQEKEDRSKVLEANLKGWEADPIHNELVQIQKSIQEKEDQKKVLESNVKGWEEDPIHKDLADVIKSIKDKEDRSKVLEADVKTFEADPAKAVELENAKKELAQIGEDLKPLIVKRDQLQKEDKVCLEDIDKAKKEIAKIDEDLKPLIVKRDQLQKEDKLCNDDIDKAKKEVAQIKEDLKTLVSRKEALQDKVDLVAKNKEVEELKKSQQDLEDTVTCLVKKIETGPVNPGIGMYMGGNGFMANLMFQQQMMIFNQLLLNQYMGVNHNNYSGVGQRENSLLNAIMGNSTSYTNNYYMPMNVAPMPSIEQYNSGLNDASGSWTGGANFFNMGQAGITDVSRTPAFNGFVDPASGMSSSMNIPYQFSPKG